MKIFIRMVTNEICQYQEKLTRGNSDEIERKIRLLKFFILAHPMLSWMVVNNVVSWF